MQHDDNVVYATVPDYTPDPHERPDEAEEGSLKLLKNIFRGMQAVVVVAEIPRDTPRGELSYQDEQRFTLYEKKSSDVSPLFGLAIATKDTLHFVVFGRHRSYQEVEVVSIVSTDTDVNINALDRIVKVAKTAWQQACSACFISISVLSTGSKETLPADVVSHLGFAAFAEEGRHEGEYVWDGNPGAPLWGGDGSGSGRHKRRVNRRTLRRSRRR